MNIFKNEVGRPSNETIRKRRVLVITFVVIGICLISGIVYGVSNYFGSNLHSKNKNAVYYVGKQYYADISTKRRDHLHTFFACPSGYTFDSSYRCIKSKTFTLSYLRNKNINTNAEARNYCTRNMYDGVSNVRLTYPSRIRKKLTFTCYKITTPEGYWASYYNQNEVASNIMSACGGGSKTLRNGGCLPSTISMVFTSLGKSYNPTSVNSYARNLCSGTTCSNGGYKICDSGSFHVQLVNKLASYRGLRVYDVASSSDLDKKLKSGKCAGVAALRSGCRGSYCYRTGHFVAVYPSDVNGRVYVSDPWDRNKMLVSETASNIISYTQAREVKVVCR